MISVYRRKGSTTYVCSLTLRGKRPVISLRTGDKTAAKDIAGRLERLAQYVQLDRPLPVELVEWLNRYGKPFRDQLRRMGLLPVSMFPDETSLTTLIDKMRAEMIANKLDADYIGDAVAQVRLVCQECGFKTPRDINAVAVREKIESWADPRGKNLSFVTRNRYLGAMKTFCDSLVRDGLIPASPLASLKRVKDKGERRRVRRALTVAEVDALITTTATQPKRCRMSGAERSLLYRVALETGLRAGELTSLRVRNLSLEGEHPIVTIEASNSKRRKQDRLPLRKDTAARLQAHVVGHAPEAPVFGMPPSTKTAEMLKADLEAAKIPVGDAKTGIVDFHSLRHTFATQLAHMNLPPKLVQELMRHSTFRLTFDIYAHADASGLHKAVESLQAKSEPAVPPEAPGTTEKTGEESAA